MRGLVLLVIVFAALPVMLVKPHVGVLFWAWMSYMNPHRLTWGFTRTFPFAAIIAVTTILGWLFSRERKMPPRDPLLILLIVWSVWISVTTLLAVFPDTAYPLWDRAIKVLFMTILTVIIMRSRERIHALVWVIALSIAYYGVKGGVFALLTGFHYRVWGPEGSFIEDNNYLAVALLMVIPLMRYLQLNTENRWLRMGLMAGMGLSVLSVISSYSRGAFLALAATSLFLALRSRRPLLLTVILMAVLVCALLVVPKQWTARMETIRTYQEDTSAMLRIKAWEFAISTANQYPIFGGGFGIFRLNTVGPISANEWLGKPSAYKVAHSIYFEVVASHGYVGLALFLTILTLGFLYAKQVDKKTRDDPNLAWLNDLGRMCQVSLVAYGVGGVFISIAFFDLPYDIIALVILARLHVTQVLDRQAAQQSLAPAI
jgi:putative inorganic carbon (HCO3(-)) transporter